MAKKRRNSRKITEPLPQNETVIKEPDSIDSASLPVKAEILNTAPELKSFHLGIMRFGRYLISLRGRVVRLFVLFGLGFIVFLGILITQAHQKWTNTQEIRRREEKKLEWYEGILRKYKDFPDAYYNAALHAAKLGKKEKARGYIKKALEYDPGFTKAEELKQAIEEL